MKTLKLSLLAAVGALALAGSAQAADRPLGLALNAGGASDYMFRGLSQTGHKAQAFAGADVSSGMFYAGTWISNVDFGGAANLEYDLYAGVKPVLGPVTFDFGAIRYGYNHEKALDLDYWEFKAAGSMAAGPATVGAAFFYSPDFTGPGNVNGYYYEVNASVPITGSKFSVSGALGHQALQGPGDYTTWNLGLGYAATDSVGIDFRYWDTANSSEYGSIADSRFVASVKATF
jgi:uncharacterized protein (TIGR02001 family)